MTNDYPKPQSKLPKAIIIVGFLIFFAFLFDSCIKHIPKTCLQARTSPPKVLYKTVYKFAKPLTKEEWLMQKADLYCKPSHDQISYDMDQCALFVDKLTKAKVLYAPAPKPQISVNIQKSQGSP